MIQKPERLQCSGVQASLRPDSQCIKSYGPIASIRDCIVCNLYTDCDCILLVYSMMSVSNKPVIFISVFLSEYLS